MNNEINELILEIEKNINRNIDNLRDEMKAGFQRMDAGFQKLTDLLNSKGDQTGHPYKRPKK